MILTNPNSPYLIASQVGTGNAVAVAKVHTAANAKERQRVQKAGGLVKDGTFNGSKMSRLMGCMRAKGKGVICTPDVLSFEVNSAQRFVVLGTEGLWTGGFTGQLAVDKVYTRLSQMDSRRIELDQARLEFPLPFLGGVQSVRVCKVGVRLRVGPYLKVRVRCSESGSIGQDPLGRIHWRDGVPAPKRSAG